MAQAGSGRYAYFASSPLANDTRGAIADAGPQEDDPTAPFESATQPESANGVSGTMRSASNLEPAGGTARYSHVDTRSLRRGPPQTSDGFPAATSLCRRRAPTRRPCFPGATTQPAERKIREALNQPTQIEFVETPLKDVIDYLKDLHHIEIQLDTSALKEAGVDDRRR